MVDAAANGMEGGVKRQRTDPGESLLEFPEESEQDDLTAQMLDKLSENQAQLDKVRY